MNATCRFFCFFALPVFAALFSFSLLSAADFRFLPSVSVSADFQRYSRNDARYRGELSRTIVADIISYSRFSLSSSIHENTFFSDEKSAASPRLIRYYIDYAEARADFSRVSVSLLLDHVCNNAIDADISLMHNDWYRAAVKVQSPGMLPSNFLRRRDAAFQHGFMFLEGFDYSISAGYVYGTFNLGYDAVVNCSFRQDFADIKGFVPYAEASLQAVLDGKWKVSRSGEAGVSYFFSGVSFSPYVRYSYLYDVDFAGGIRAPFKSFGVKLSSSFENYARPENFAAREVSSVFDPRLSFDAEYAKYFSSGYLAYHSLFGVRLDVLKSGVTPFFRAALSHDSLREDQAMWPRYLHYSASGGFAARIRRSLICDVYGERLQRHYGNLRRTLDENAFRLGVKLYSPQSVASSPGAHFFADCGAILKDENFDYRTDVSAGAGYGAAFHFNTIVYANIFIRARFIPKSAPDFGTEFGIRRENQLSCGAFIRLERKTSIDRTGGISEYQGLLGIFTSFGSVELR